MRRPRAQRRPWRRAALAAIPLLLLLFTRRPDASRSAVVGHPSVVVFTSRRGVDRCLKLVKMAAELRDQVQDRGAFGVGVRVVLEGSASPSRRLLCTVAQASVAGLLASVLRALDVVCDGADFVAQGDIEPPEAREAWALAALRQKKEKDPPLVLLLRSDSGEEVLLVDTGDAGMRRSLARVIAWALDCGSVPPRKKEGDP